MPNPSIKRDALPRAPYVKRMHWHSNRTTGFLVLAAGYLWFFACLGLSYLNNGGYIMGRIWLVTAFVLPTAFAIGGALLQKPMMKMPSSSSVVRGVLSFGVIFSLVLGYALCTAIFGEISVIWSRILYEGSTSLRLELAKLFAPLWTLFALAVYSLYRCAPVGRYIGFLNQAALSLIASTSILSLLFFLSVSLYVRWRA
jgi:hypothetical protein